MHKSRQSLCPRLAVVSGGQKQFLRDLTGGGHTYARWDDRVPAEFLKKKLCKAEQIRPHAWSWSPSCTMVHHVTSPTSIVSGTGTVRVSLQYGMLSRWWDAKHQNESPTAECAASA